MVVGGASTISNGMDSKTVKHIARLARIKITEKEEEKMKEELSAILGYIEQLNKVETEGIEPLYQNTGLLNSTRPDKYREDFKVGGELHEKLIGQAPEKEGRFVKVRSVLSK